MARSYSLSVERSGHANAETAFDLLRDATTWKDWAGWPISFSGWRDVSPTDDSVVSRVRLVGTHRFKTAEQITDDERPVLHGYRILANWPVKDYRARVVLTAGTEGMLTVTWSGEFTERIPGTGILAALSHTISRKPRRTLDRSRRGRPTNVTRFCNSSEQVSLTGGRTGASLSRSAVRPWRRHWGRWPNHQAIVTL